MLVLSGACMSGKSHLLKKLKKQLKNQDVVIFDTDSLEYWKDDVKNKAEEDFVNAASPNKSIYTISAFNENFRLSSPHEKVVKLKWSKMARLNKDAIVTCAVDRGAEYNNKFFEILSSEYNVDVVFLSITASVPRFLLNIFRRKDKKSYRQTWGIRKDIIRHPGRFGYSFKNTVLFGQGVAIKTIKSILGYSDYE
ncbi:MAG: hypothetical protein V7721_03005 [Porticoccaceae bacterium]